MRQTAHRWVALIGKTGTDPLVKIRCTCGETITGKTQVLAARAFAKHALEIIACGCIP